MINPIDEKTISGLKAYFEFTLNDTRRPGMQRVLHELDNGGFFQSPASSRHHLAFAGGLLMHSVNVYRAAMSLIKMEPHLLYEDDSLAIACLLHDVCKMGRYKACHDGTQPYDTDYADAPYGGHGEKSVMMLQTWGLRMSEEEMAAIRWHMGAWGPNTNFYEEVVCYQTAIKKFPLVTIVQMADQYAAHILERNC